MDSKPTNYKHYFQAEKPEVVAKLLSNHEGFVFFDSSGATDIQKDEPISIISCNPSEIVHFKKGEEEAFQVQLDKRYRLNTDTVNKDAEAAYPSGAAMGWFDYKANAIFGFYDDLLIYLHHQKRWVEVGDTHSWFEGIRHSRPSVEIQSDFTSSFDKEGYEASVESLKEAIAQGLIYQANLSIQYRAAVSEGSGYELYENLRRESPAPMGAYLNLGEEQILSSSPEVFLKFNQNEVVSKPIKGTRPRSSDSVRDDEYLQELTTSEKERSELIMITDLLRNDLGEVCKVGSVRVSELLKVESYQHVHHLVSEIRGELEGSQLEAVLSCLPGGSITGAPKRSAVNLIEELEPVPRGSYTGSMGFFGYNGVSQFNLLIRSLYIKEGTISYSTGAGIVADSDPGAEYLETQQKAKGIRNALNSYQS